MNFLLKLLVLDYMIDIAYYILGYISLKIYYYYKNYFAIKIIFIN